MLTKKLHLIISVIVIVPVAMAYGIYPKTVLWYLFAIEVNTVGLTGIFRAMMGLYLAFAALWILGIIKKNYWQTATFSNVVFMGGLAMGRLLSLALDGQSPPIFLAGLVLEIILCLWGIKNLK